MRTVRTLTFACTGLLLSGCQANAAPTDLPAHVVNPTTESRGELVRVVRHALNGSKVTIAGDALTNDNLLIIEPKHLMGRDLRKPEHFRLVLSDASCLLVHEETGTRMPLTETACVAD